MVSEEVEIGAKGQGPSQHQHIPLLALRLDSNENNENDGGFRWEEKDEGYREKTLFE